MLVVLHIRNVTLIIKTGNIIMADSYKVLILGYGEMGHAMESLLAGRHQLFIWDKLPQAGFQSVVLEDSVPLADIILLCLPVNPHREILQHIKPLLAEHTICLSIAKGLDEEGHTASQIFKQILQDQPHALLYGPMISEEIIAGRYAFAQVGCRTNEVYKRINSLFADTSLFTEQSSDIAGISWSVILKNVYALVFGMADQLALGDNTRGFFMVTALRELEQIVIKMGGKPASPFHLAGLGDLVATATSKGSHHYELGRRLARGETENIRGEGVHTLLMIEKHRLLNTSAFPLMQLLQQIVKQPKDAQQKIAVFIQQHYSNTTRDASN
jgi:glycerol-3-phosphate dehydrogenase (NAD(P)+)